MQSTSSNERVQSFEYVIQRHIYICIKSYKVKNPSVEGIIKAQTSRRLFSHRPDLEVAPAKFGTFKLTALPLLLRRAAGSA